MTNKIIGLVVIILLGVLSLGQVGKTDKKDITAYIVKVVRDVNMKSPTKGWQKAIPLSTLKSGYEVKTEKGSLAMISFADQSKLILREKSIVTIKGEVKGKEILSRNVHMDRGNMIFNVKKAESEQFKFSSPISVASIRGTLGNYVSGGVLDSLTIADGLADFLNSISGKKGTVGAGQTGVADSSGNFKIGKANRNILNNIRQSQNLGGLGSGADDNGVDFGHLKSRQTGSVRVDLSAFQGKAIAASLLYRVEGEHMFNELPLTVTGQTATGKIPSNKVKYPKLEYYLSVKLNNGSTVLIPENGPTDPASVSVEATRRELRIPGQTGSLQKKVVVIRWNE
ncbi:MAG: FecR domain-containing protein [Bacteroidetes bacterium]|nr:FecR domain-containing protein [Bacteroidota bacterium]